MEDPNQLQDTALDFPGVKRGSSYQALSLLTVLWSFLMGLFNDARQIAKRDPAARSVVGVMLMYPGFHALVFHKISHFLYRHHLRAFARWNSQLARLCTGIEIHPGACIGEGLFIDHGMGVVIGETARIGDNCTIYHNVTLGGRGHAAGERRHPIIGDNVLVGAGAKLLGPITVGSNTNIGANAVLLRDIPDNATVVGVPGKIVRIEGKVTGSHAVELDHANSEDPVQIEVTQLVGVVNSLQGTIAQLQHELQTMKNDIQDGRCRPCDDAEE